MITASMVLTLAALGHAAFTDLKRRTIYDGVPLTILAAGVLLLLFSEHTFFDAICGLIVCGGPFFVCSKLKPNSFGEGDVLLMASIGFALGSYRSLSILIISLTLSALTALLFRKKVLPLAPFVFLGTAVTQLILR